MILQVLYASISGFSSFLNTYAYQQAVFTRSLGPCDLLLKAGADSYLADFRGHR